nr:MAG TPA: hypothetical protein [Caudoviricetes sp.]
MLSIATAFASASARRVFQKNCIALYIHMCYNYY